MFGDIWISGAALIICERGCVPAKPTVKPILEVKVTCLSEDEDLKFNAYNRTAYMGEAM